MRSLVSFRGLAREKARLTHVEIEALEAPIPQTDYRELLARVALGLMPGALRGRHPMQHRQPHEALRFLLQPRQEVGGLQLFGLS